jgi:hypothetical protein
MRIRRRKQPEQLPRASEDDVRGIALQKAVNRLSRLFAARTVPPVSALDGLSEITDDDIAAAVKTWDDAQKDAETGLDGLLDARVQGG